MISFDPFWEMLEDRGITSYELEYIYDLNPAEISRLRHNHNFTLKFINRLCDIFDCQPHEIISYDNPSPVCDSVKNPEEELSIHE